MLYISFIICMLLMCGCSTSDIKISEEDIKYLNTYTKQLERAIERSLTSSNNEKEYLINLDKLEEKLELFKVEYNYELTSPYVGLSYENALVYFEDFGSNEVKQAHEEEQRKEVIKEANYLAEQFAIKNMKKSLAFDKQNDYYLYQESLNNINEKCNNCLISPYIEFTFEEAKEYCNSRECTSTKYYDRIEGDNISTTDKYVNNDDHSKETDNYILYCTDDKDISDTTLWVCAQKVVEDSLKSPKSADFGWLQEPTITKKSSEILVEGYVDAENSFGAEIRNKFIVIFTQDGNYVKEVFFY